MLQRVEAKTLEDLLLPMGRRPSKGVYFVRLNGCDRMDLIWRYHEAAREKGVILEGSLANPDDRQLGYLRETLGSEFRPDPAFIVGALRKWMPRMSAANRQEFASALCAQFDEMRAKGKPEAVLKNVYAKMMCWLYYRFERLMPFLGDDDPPRILYECGKITAHELILLRILSAMGADVLILETQGDDAYLKQDPTSVYSQLMTGKAFENDFTLKKFRKEMSAQTARQASKAELKPGQTPVSSAKRNEPDLCAYFRKPNLTGCTNAWMKEPSMEQILLPARQRGDDFRLFYNAFIRVKGVNNCESYTADLYRFYQKLHATGRNLLIIDEPFQLPDADEVNQIRRGKYSTAAQMIIGLAVNLPSCSNADLQDCVASAYAAVLEEAAKAEPNLNRLLLQAVYLICRIRRYQSDLFRGYKGGECACCVLMGGCRNAHDTLFLRFLSRVPVDVLILAPDLGRPCELTDERLLEITGLQSLPVMRFPRDAASVMARTTASGAEEELNNALYSGSGIYRNKQFAKAETVALQTTYDEIFMLWNEELKYRPGFDTVGDTAMVPVIYAKISGIEKKQTLPYWQKIKLLLDKDTLLVDRLPMLMPGDNNRYQSLALKVLRNGHIDRETLRMDRNYPFGLLREELQNHMLDKLQLMLDRKLIRGTYVNGTEYTVIATVLNLRKDMLRVLQSFDFTKRNPKIVCISTGEQTASLEDTILFTFLNLVGFDIAIFAPTGYQTIRPHLNGNFPVDHEIGDYVYDLQVPDFAVVPDYKRSWLDMILKRRK